jgi:hypothetical protein
MYTGGRSSGVLAHRPGWEARPSRAALFLALLPEVTCSAAVVDVQQP